METYNTCRLCLLPSSDESLNIFSTIAIEMKILDILCEHFKCDISESDPLPNIVCQMCWSTTEAFHELYVKSRVAQERFLNPLVKTEFDPISMWPIETKNTYKENSFIIESNLEVEPIKIEPNSDDSGSDDNTRTNYEEQCNEESVDGRSNDDSGNDDSNSDLECESDNKPPTSVRALKRWRRKRREIKFKKLFDEQKHLFDLTCDFCSETLKSLYDSRTHYSTAHNKIGYIKCCGLKLRFRCQIITHLNRHLEPDKYKCTQCDKMLSTVRELDKHVQRMHSEMSGRKSKDIQCDICKKMFASKITLERHLKRHGEKKESEEESKFIADNFDMTCDQCDATFTSLYDARSHYKHFHNEKGYVKCCGSKLRELWMVRDHIKFHLNPESFKCDVCGKTYTSRLILVQHTRRHRLTMNKNFICDYCRKSFRDKDAIMRHIFTNHVDSEPKHECDICHKKLRLPSLLKNHHYSVHREKKPSVTCEICGKSFYVRFHLDKHMLSHTDKSERLAQRQQCEHCGEWLMTKSGIYYHEQIHTTGIQNCTQCEMKLPNKLALLAHIRQYHREHKFKCSYCEKTFSTASVLKTHEEGHTRHNVYQCKFCPKVFTVPSSRRTHTRRNHLEELKMSK